VIGSGKTVLLRRLQEILEDERKITVSKSLSVEKRSRRYDARNRPGHRAGVDPELTAATGRFRAASLYLVRHES
jgi:ABC-type transport system involved in cytochrome c biogenesis ATPase subunit